MAKLLQSIFSPGQAWTQDGGQMSERLKQALGRGEVIKFFQRAQMGNLVIIRYGVWLLAIIFLCTACQALGQDSLCGTISLFIALFLFAIPFFLPEYEYAVTETRVLVGQRVLGNFSFNIVSIDMISGVRIGSSTFPFSLFGSSVLELQHVGGPTHLPAMGGREGQSTALWLTRLLEEGRTNSAQRRAQAAAPVYAAPPIQVPMAYTAASPVPLDKKTQLDLLRQRLLEGSINQDTYNMLRQEIEGS